MITQNELKALLHYDPETGLFTRLVTTVHNARAGQIAGTLDTSNGYTTIGIKRKNYYAHRLAWLYCHGTFPPDGLDHINRIKTDNRICNLRLANQSENGQNHKKRIDNKSGYVGVVWSKSNKKWMAQIGVKGKNKILGFFIDKEKAAESYIAAKAQLHTFHPVQTN